MPTSFGPDVEIGSPFANGADPFKTPDRFGGAGGVPLPQQSFPGVGAWDGGKNSIFEPSRKENKLLFVFTQDAKDFKLWRNRIMDHFCRSTQLWRWILEYVKKGPSMFHEKWLRNTNVAGVNAWDLSTILEAFLVDWFPKSMYNRRTQLAGGEFGNGFEMWRRLYIEYQGGSEAVEFGGVRRLQEFPRCTQVNKLSEHLDDWLDVLTTYGSELEHCPRMLRNMVMGVIPVEFENEIVEKSMEPGRTDFRTYHGIIKWCKTKVDYKRQK